MDFALERDYQSVWAESQNQPSIEAMRELLVSGSPVRLVLQPGDGTRYHFLLVPEGKAFCISDDGREPQEQRVGKGTLLVTEIDGLAQGVASICCSNAIEGIRYRLADKMEIRNACTAEALARTIEALWSE